MCDNKKEWDNGRDCQVNWVIRSERERAGLATQRGESAEGAGRERKGAQRGNTTLRGAISISHGPALYLRQCTMLLQLPPCH